MTKSTKILSLSAAALLAVIVLIVIVRRRGRKVFLNDKYRLNNQYYIYIHPEDDWNNTLYYNGTLDYVIVPHNAQTVESDGTVFVQISGIGELGSDGKVRRMNLKGSQFIDTSYLNN